MSLAARIAFSCLALVAILVALSAYQLAAIHDLHATNRELSQVRFAAAREALAIERRLDALDEFGAKYQLLGDPAYAAELERLRGEVTARLEALAALPLSAGEAEELELLAARWGAYLRQVTNEEKGVGELVREQLQRFSAASERAVAERVAAGARRVERAVRASWAVTALGVLLATAATLLIVRAVAAPLARLTAGTRELADGQMFHRVQPSGVPELADLAVDFNAMADRLAELDRLKSDFVSGVSHDLKAPLASIEETIRLLLEGIPGPLGEEQERLLGLALGSARRLGSLIADLLDLARLDAGALTFQASEQDLAALVAGACDSVEPRLAAKRLDLQRRLPREPLVVRCDERYMLRLLDNLLANAVAHSPPGGTLGVEVGRQGAGGGGVVVEVSDQGPGVPDGEKERIFRRFHRAVSHDTERSSKLARTGAGLGLAIARAVAEGHGGSIRVEDRPGGGSRFILTLPAARVAGG